MCKPQKGKRQPGAANCDAHQPETTGARCGAALQIKSAVQLEPSQKRQQLEQRPVPELTFPAEIKTSPVRA